MKTRRLYVVIVVCLLSMGLLNACGFKLRGALELSQNLSPIYLQQNSLFELGRHIKQLLNNNAIQIAKNEQNANTFLTLISETKSRRVLAVDGDGRAREYLLSYRVDFSVKVKSGKDMKAVDVEYSITISRSLLFESEAVLAVTNESEVLYKDMQRDAARLILLKLQAQARNSSIASSNDVSNDIGKDAATDVIKGSGDNSQ